MTDFEKLQKAIKEGKIVELTEGKNGTIRFYLVHNDDIGIGLSAPQKPEDAITKPQTILVSKHIPINIPYQL